MSTYNLNDNVNDSFEFEVGGHKYIMRYPLVEELDEIREVAKENKKLREKGDKDKGEELQAKLYSFISPEKEDSPSIDQVLKKQNVKVMMNFNTMFFTEFGLE
jgi:bifunctional DNA-binding transcriptional regulator/antitoxin component of YhaV-PrlF toxin-antitoxin module